MEDMKRLKQFFVAPTGRDTAYSTLDCRSGLHDACDVCHCGCHGAHA